MFFLDNQTLDRLDLQVIEIHKVLIRSYKWKMDALAIAGQVGLLQADIGIYPKMRHTWWSILEEAARNKIMRDLINIILKDPSSNNYHEQIRTILKIDTLLLIDDEKEQPNELGDKPVVGDKALLWPFGHILKIRFLDGDQALHKRIEAVARQWLQYVNLNFDFGAHPDAEIRISFQENTGSWTYLGTQAATAPDSQPTLNFGWLEVDTSEEEIQRTVLHYFGNVLGLQKEHAHPLSALDWDRKKIYKELSGPPNYWSKEMVDRNVFRPWPPDYFPVRKVFDRASIMMHAFPGHFFRSGKAIDQPNELSPLDKQFAAAIYPVRRPTP